MLIPDLPTPTSSVPTPVLQWRSVGQYLERWEADIPLILHDLSIGLTVLEMELPEHLIPVLDTQAFSYTVVLHNFIAVGHSPTQIGAKLSAEERLRHMTNFILPEQQERILAALGDESPIDAACPISYSRVDAESGYLVGSFQTFQRKNREEESE